MSDSCKAAMLEAGVPYPCAADCPCALEIENKALRAENERMRGLVKLIRRDADEWAISRITGNPSLEEEKANRLWKTIRNASAATAPIEASAALNERKENE